MKFIRLTKTQGGIAFIRPDRIDVIDEVVETTTDEDENETYTPVGTNVYIQGRKNPIMTPTPAVDIHERLVSWARSGRFGVEEEEEDDDLR